MYNSLKKILLVAVLLGIVCYVTQSWDITVLNTLTPNWGLIALSCFLLSLHFGLVAILSFFVLTPVKSMPFSRYAEVYFITQMGRYIPGKIWMIAGKIEMLKNEGFSKTWIAGTAVLELLLMIFGAAMVSVFSFFQENPLANVAKYRWILVIIIAGALIVILGMRQIWRLAIRGISSLNRSDFASEYASSPYSAPYMILLSIGYTTSWIIQGIAFFLLISAFFPTHDHFYFYVITYALSWIVGFLSIFAPSGLGVKESMIILLLNQVMLPSESIIIAIVSRIWSSGIEIVLAASLTLKSLLRK